MKVKTIGQPKFVLTVERMQVGDSGYIHPGMYNPYAETVSGNAEVTRILLRPYTLPIRREKDGYVVDLRNLEYRYL